MNSTNADTQKKKKIPEWLSAVGGFIGAVAVLLLIAGIYSAIITTVHLRTSYQICFAAIFAVLLLLPVDSALKYRNKRWGLRFIPLFVIWCFASGSGAKIYRAMTEENYRDIPRLLELVLVFCNEYPFVPLILLALFLFFMHGPFKKRLTACEDRQNAAFTRLVFKNNACAYAAPGEVKAVTEQTFLIYKDADTESIFMLTWVIELILGIEFAIAFISETLWKYPDFILKLVINTFVVLLLQLAALWAYELLVHALFMKNKRTLVKKQKELDACIASHPEAQHIIDGFYDIQDPFFDRLCGVPKREKHFEDGFIQLNRGKGFCSCQNFGFSASSRNCPVLIETGVELVALTHYAAGDVLHKKIDDYIKSTWNDSSLQPQVSVRENADLPPLSFTICIRDEKSESRDLSAIPYAADRADYIIKSLDCALKSVQQKQVERKPLGERIKTLRETLKNENISLPIVFMPVVYASQSLHLKPYEIEINCKGKELLREELVGDDAETLLAGMSQAEFGVLLDDKIIAALEKVARDRACTMS